MTPPIRIRRRWHPDTDARPASWSRLWLFGADPWWWTCRACLGFRFAPAPTHEAALAAGLAHLEDHTETPQ